MAHLSRLAFSVVLILVLTSVAFPQHYSIQDLGILPGAHNSGAAAMSFQRVVGTSGLLGSDIFIHAFLWSPSTGMQDLGTFPGGNNSFGYGVNSHGVVVGEAVGLANGNYYIHAFSWTPATGMRDLGILPGGTYSRAVGINGSGLIVGYGDFPNAGTFTHAILWSPAGMTDLGAISGQESSGAAAIDRAGDAVGFAGSHAALWRADGTFTDLGTVPGTFISAATSISGGRIVGWSDGPGKPQAFLWTRGKGMQSLGLLPGGSYSVATAVRGTRVVGYGDNSYVNFGPTVGFLWTPDGGMADLSKMLVNGNGWTLTYVDDINDAGQIVGTGWFDGAYHAFLLTPVP